MRRLDRPLLLIVGLLLTYGVLVLFSAGQMDIPSLASGIWIKQLVWICIALAGAFLSSRISHRVLEWAAPPLYILGVVLLLVVLVAGTGAGTAASTKSWLSIGGMRIGQPVELAKLATILMLARWFTARRDPPTTIRGLIPPLLIAGLPTLLVLAQPDLGSAMVFGGILFAMIFWAGVPIPILVLLASPVFSLLLSGSTLLWSIWMVVLFALLLIWRPFVWEGIAIYVLNSVTGVLAIVVWNKMAPYQRGRIISFLNPEAFAATTGYQGYQSTLAIGSGGLFGQGFTLGPQKRTGYIPEHWTDFVFSVVGEELGLIGVLVALGLFLALLSVMTQIARRASDPYASMVTFGLVGLIFTHIFENIGMVISIMPITGIPLPFFSYGGSFLVTVFLGLGLAYRTARDERVASYIEN
ncbi:MAG: FtsW/RodA/SpoVE family cell cycle protein [Gemmatimonadota bacterium]